MWLIDHGYLERIEERTYSVGQRFSTRNTQYIIGCLGTGKIIAINLSTGDRKNNYFNVGNVHKITQAEMDKIAGGLGSYRTIE